MNELFINSIDLSPYIVGISESGNVIGIKAPPELVRDVFLSLKPGGSWPVFFWDGNTINWRSFLPDEERGWIQMELSFEQYNRVWFWLRFDE